MDTTKANIYSDLANSVASIVTVISTTTLAIYFLIKEYKRVQLKYRTKLSKDWTNEGDVSSIGKLTHYLNFSLSVDKEDGEITGILETRKINTDIELSNVSIIGKIRYKTAIIELVDFNRGKLIKYGKAKLQLKQNGKVVKWITIKKNDDAIPTEAVCWSSLPTIV